MPAIPTFLLKKLYVKGSLKSSAAGFSLTIKNTLSPGTIVKVSPMQIDGQKIAREDMLITHKGETRPASAITPAHPLIFNLNDEATLTAGNFPLEPGVHALVVTIMTAEVGELKIQVEEKL